MRRLLLFVIIFLLYSNTLIFASANIRFQHITVDDGLSQSSVTCILQDHNGFLWFGTQNGLDRYNGYEFIVYKNDPFDSTSLGDNWVKVLWEDANGDLWIGTHNSGLFRFHPETETFLPFKHDPKNPASLSHNRIWALYGDHQGNLWVGTSNGLDRLDRQTLTFEHVLKQPTIPSRYRRVATNALWEDHAGNLWIGTWGAGLARYSPATKEIIPLPLSPGNKTLFGINKIKCIYQYNDGDVWVGTWGAGLYRLNEQGQVLDHYFVEEGNPYSLADNHIRTVYQDREGFVWVGTHHGGLNRLDKKTGRVTRFQHDPLDPFSISDNWIASIYEDPFGNLWVGTGAGLNKFNQRSKNFYHFKHSPLDSNSLSSNSVISLLQDRQGVIWIGTWGKGLNRMEAEFDSSGNISNVKFEHLRHQPGNTRSISDDIVWTLFEDHRGNLWIGTYNGLDRLSPDRTRFEHYFNGPQSPLRLSHNNISAIWEDRKGELWVGTWGGGLNRLDLEKGTVKYYKFRPDDPTSLSDNLITTIYEDKEGRLWIGTEGGGLNLFNSETESFFRFQYNRLDSLSLSSNTITKIWEDSRGNLWVATGGGGLNCLRWKDPAKVTEVKIDHYTEADGLPDNFVNGILEDEAGDLWISTGNGLARFEVEKGFFQVFTHSDGLQSNEFSQACALGQNGWLLFGGSNGFNMFQPRKIKKKRQVPPVVITGYALVGRKINLNEPPNQRQSISLSYKDDLITFEFAALDFTYPEKNQYAYKLEGVDQDWVYSGNRRFATYAHLNPGHYVFRVKGSNSDGVWNEAGTSIQLIIHPPFWMTWWFRIFVIALIIGVALTSVRIRIRSIEKQKEKLANLVAERTKELEAKNVELQEALNNIKTLRGLIPICSSCKKIRDDQGYWNQLEKYLREHSEAEFSHSICPDCAKKLYPEVFVNKK